MPLDPSVDTTPAEALTAVRDYFVELQADREDFRDWCAGTVDGGPENNGNYPLRDFTGNVHLVPCPAKIAAIAEATAEQAVLGKLSRAFDTYAALWAIPGQIDGQIGIVDLDDIGTHIDPVTDDEVANAGFYKWNEAEANWQWIYPLVITTDERLPYNIPFGFTVSPTTGEVMLLHVVTEEMILPINFAGSRGYVGANPVANFILDIYKGVTEIGTVTISPAGVVTFAAVAETIFAIGDVIRVVAPVVTSSSIANVAITLLGTVER